RAKARHLPSCIITGDTDLCQLIDKDTEVRLIPSGGGFGVTEIMTADRWERKKGYPPHLIAEFKALAGDPSDNIPGFKGVGKKTALALLKEYGDLDGVLKNAWQIKGAIGRRIYYGNDEALLWKELTTVCREAPVEITAGELKWQFDPHRACACLERLSVLDEGLRGKLMRLAGTVSETKRSAG
ncbi:MAG: 5'-3' exonuclease H3TH domain-containing protein, partial [Clostridia bacterium]|nr:5'-3' exonuclease H3TH domain-containing protein [Clostridia bacterium]